MGFDRLTQSETLAWRELCMDSPHPACGHVLHKSERGGNHMMCSNHADPIGRRFRFSEHGCVADQPQRLIPCRG